MTLRRLVPVLLAATVLVGGLAVVRVCTAEEEPSPFQNVTVLTQVKDKRQMRSIMKAQSDALGVKCTFCHVKGKFALDDKELKVEAREMMKMVEEINSKWFADAPADEKVSCWTCHRGSEHPEFSRPPEAETDDGMTGGGQ